MGRRRKPRPGAEVSLLESKRDTYEALDRREQIVCTLLCLPIPSRFQAWAADSSGLKQRRALSLLNGLINVLFGRNVRCSGLAPVACLCQFTNSPHPICTSTNTLYLIFEPPVLRPCLLRWCCMTLIHGSDVSSWKRLGLHQMVPGDHQPRIYTPDLITRLVKTHATDAPLRSWSLESFYMP